MQSTQFPEVNKFLSYLIKNAKDQINPKKIILFGSRARGDAPIFLKFDLVNLNEAQPLLKKIKTSSQFQIKESHI